MADERIAHEHTHEHCDHNHGKGTPTVASAVKPGTYICPMCSGVESDGPSTCPKCGSGLTENSKFTRHVHRFTIGDII